MSPPLIYTIKKSFFNSSLVSLSLGIFLKRERIFDSYNLTIYSIFCRIFLKLHHVRKYARSIKWAKEGERN